jgi:hypothetical protein
MEQEISKSYFSVILFRTIGLWHLLGWCLKVKNYLNKRALPPILSVEISFCPSFFLHPLNQGFWASALLVCWIGCHQSCCVHCRTGRSITWSLPTYASSTPPQAVKIRNIFRLFQMSPKGRDILGFSSLVENHCSVPVWSTYSVPNTVLISGKPQVFLLNHTPSHYKKSLLWRDSYGKP